jgi:hypothetical protein
MKSFSSRSFAVAKGFLLSMPALLVLALPSAAQARDFVYEGSWHTTANRKSDGPMTCVLSEMGREHWKARFVGSVQGARFDYTVNFDGPPSDLFGDAMIDGILYDWQGSVDRDRFQGTFTGGSRYRGYFNLQRKVTKSP